MSVFLYRKCRSTLEKLWETYKVPIPEGLSGMLVRQLQCEHERLRLMSAQLLFDLHMRGHILLSDAVDSYLADRSDEATETDPTVSSMILYGSFSDEKRLLKNMLKDMPKDNMNDDIDDFSRDCFLEDDPAEPHVCNQSLVYTTSQ